MANRITCNCRRCAIRGLRSPAFLITIGLIFLVSEWHGDYLSARYTWPVILIVMGLIRLAEHFVSDEGHLIAAPPAPSASPAGQTGQGN